MNSATAAKHPQQRVRVAVLFGGRSVEHEISVITALDFIDAVDCRRYDVIPVYIAPNGRWYSGKELLQREFYKGLPAATEKLTEVTVLPKPDVGGLTVLKRPAKDGRGPSRRTDEAVIPVDVFVPAFHGQFGEDGCIQGLLEMADAAYTSAELPALAVAMNKQLCKLVARAVGVPVLPAATVRKSEIQRDLPGAVDRVLATPGLSSFPLFVKPCNLGSSIGIGKAADRTELAEALARVAKFDLTALVEPCVNPMYEINVSIADFGEPTPSVVEIPGTASGTLTYEEKYMMGGGKKTGAAPRGMASLARVIDPPDLPREMKDAVTNHALTLFKAISCNGIVRFDFIVDSAKNEVFFNELNPIPGSFSFYLWVKSTPRRLYTESITTIIERARERQADKYSLERDVGFKALFR